MDVLSLFGLKLNHVGLAVQLTKFQWKSEQKEKVLLLCVG